jgi:light-regulated signal transduction histidine kinase (bacteriophytochrome)
MRALTGSDQCLLVSSNDAGERGAHSSRGGFGQSSLITDLPPIVADISAAPVPIYPRKPGDGSIARALLRSPPADALQPLRDQQISSAMNVPISFEGRPVGVFQCGCRSARDPNLELHAAAELFAQMFALCLEVDRLRST